MRFNHQENLHVISLKCLITRQALEAIKRGMRLTRGATPKAMMKRAEALTGITYKARDYDQAIADLNALRDSANAQLS
jgi:hypothetical protein